MLRSPDYAQLFLEPYLRGTESLMRSALMKLDPCSEVYITPAADLCIPHDVVRLAGGFPTGCFVQWKCAVPVIPVDAAVNIDTTSIFDINGDILRKFTTETFEDLRHEIEETSSYEWNFHKGNHFISLCQRESDSGFVLIIHSNEKEFKYQSNGLCPVPNNWYHADIQTFHQEGRYIRLLVGEKAALFARMAKMLEEFNIIRHAYVAARICDSVAALSHEKHTHHYYMPDANSVAIGCYLCRRNDEVPIFSRPGYPITVFRAQGSSETSVTINGVEHFVVPHGWGKTSLSPVELKVGASILTLNGLEFPIEARASMGKHPGLSLREFNKDPTAPDSFFSEISHTCPGITVDSYRQIISYTKEGVVRHSN